MKQLFFFVIIMLVGENLHAQFGSAQSVNPNGGVESVAVDIDGDTDIDVVSCRANGVSWSENLDGNGAFGPEQIIASGVDLRRSVFVADIDGDDDPDIVSAAIGEFGTIEWYENMSGQGDFGSAQIIAPNSLGVQSIFLVDVDGDLDIDVLYANFLSDEIGWHENLDGLGTFSNEITITNLANGANSVFAIDIDGDTDIDVLSASELDNKIAWYENIDGLGSFGPQQVISVNTLEAFAVYSADLDGDTDMDVLSASPGDNKVAWYENLDGQGAFGGQQIISTNSLMPRSVYAVDLDGDNDNDVLSASLDVSGSKLVWYENTNGQGSFGTENTISIDEGGMFVRGGDFDGDTDIDVLLSGVSGLFWYENLHPLSVVENNLLDFTLYPNPAKNRLYINSNPALVIEEIKIYDAQGRIVYRTGTPTIILDVSMLQSGLYLLTIITETGEITTKKFVKE